MIVPSFKEIISLENLLSAWKEFLVGKKQRKDVQIFERNLMENIILLHKDLLMRNYRHSEYEAFNISDPKPRNIHKATVRDRLLHHAIYRVLYPYFDTKFIHDSYSCRKWKGTHRAMSRFSDFARKASQNNRKTVWILKCDVRKFFASIDQKRLVQILEMYDLDKDTIWLLSRVMESFQSTEKGKGLPLGNLTSQLLVNIYMNWFDQYMRHRLKAKYYIRYADDFVVMSQDKQWLEQVFVQTRYFLKENLLLDLHPNKVSIQTLASGADFLGWVHFPAHRVLRTTTKRRMLKNVANNPSEATVQSYLGMLRHGNTEKLKNIVKLKTT